MTLAEFHERVCEPPLAQVRKKGALPLCCCVLTQTAQPLVLQCGPCSKNHQCGIEPSPAANARAQIARFCLLHVGNLSESASMAYDPVFGNQLKKGIRLPSIVMDGSLFRRDKQNSFACSQKLFCSCLH